MALRPAGLSLIEALLGTVLLASLMGGGLFLYQHSQQLATQSQSRLVLARLQHLLAQALLQGHLAPMQPGQTTHLNSQALQSWLGEGNNLTNTQNLSANIWWLQQSQSHWPPVLYQTQVCLNQHCQNAQVWGAAPIGQTSTSLVARLTLELLSQSCPVNLLLSGPNWQNNLDQPGQHHLDLPPGTYTLVAQSVAPCSASPTQEQLNLLSGQAATYTFVFARQP